MKRLLKRALLAAAPEWTTGLLSARAWAHSHRMVREWGLTALTEKLLAALGPVVRSGPFRGMTLTPMTHQEHLGPFLLGTYEFELHPWVTLVAGGRYAQILDVGAKFGYYAVGLARLSANTSVVAFDTDWWARAASREMAAENRTPNVEVAGFCSPLWLDQNLRPGSLILCDCEGYEGDLLTRSTSSALSSATLIVETHDDINPGVTDAIRRRFAGTHRVATVSADLAIGPIPPIDLSFLTADEARSAVREVRGRQTWILLDTGEKEGKAVKNEYILSYGARTTNPETKTEGSSPWTPDQSIPNSHQSSRRGAFLRDEGPSDRSRGNDFPCAGIIGNRGTCPQRVFTRLCLMLPLPATLRAFGLLVGYIRGLIFARVQDLTNP